MIHKTYVSYRTYRSYNLVNLVPKLLFGNALLETPVSRRLAARGRTRNGSFAECVPKQEFGNEGFSFTSVDFTSKS
jgi:hypothetical protein